MRTVRLADLFDLKYQLTSVAVDANLMADVRKRLKTLREMWLDGPAVKDQTILLWADKENKGPQFELIRELVYIVKTLAVDPSLDELETYKDVQRGLTISKILKDSTLREISDAAKLSLKGRLRHPDINKIDHQESKIRTFLRRLDSTFDAVKNILSKHIPADQKKLIDAESQGGYEEQKAKQLSKNDIARFAFHPEAYKYGLDNVDFITTLLNETKLRPLLEYLIRAVKRGHKPKAAPVILSANDSFQDLQNKLKTNISLFDSSEEEAQEQLGWGRKQEELEDRQRELAALTPAQQWSRQMQEAKKQLALEREEEPPPMLTPEQLDEKIKQRDLEHEQRERALISKYNGLTFERWMRKL